MFKQFFNRFKKVNLPESIIEEPVFEDVEPEEIEEPENEPENPYLVKTKKTGYKHAFINLSMTGRHDVNYHGAYEYTEETLLPIRQDSTNPIPEEPEEPHLPEI